MNEEGLTEGEIMSYSITGTTITLTRGDTFEALVSATKKDGTQYIPVEGE